LSTGGYSYQFLRGHVYEVVLEFEAPKVGRDLRAMPPDDPVIKWRKDQISDFEHKLALLDNIEGKEGDIQSLIKWNEVCSHKLCPMF
jgi:hypothetical protein